jgi:orotate phosphoribosyltransferase
MSEEKNRLLALLRDRSVKRGDFVLASGRRSELYLDVRQTSLHAEGGLCIGQQLFAQLRPDVVAVGGLTLGADPLVTATSVVAALAGRPVHAFIIRKEAKEHGAKDLVVGRSNLSAGDRVAIVEDTTTTGGSLLKAVERARDIGLDVVQCITVVDREEGARELLAANGLQLEALVTRSELV